DIRHLDNTNSDQERKDILHWFKTKPDAILTSVGILTTGFDEPTVETIILNRATKSLTLFYQMIGRGSRILPNKSEFTVIDLGNNALRFGLWDSYIDWQAIFRAPDYYLQNLSTDVEIERQFKYVMPAELREKFSKSESVEFNIKEEYALLTKQGLRPKAAIENSIEQHARICAENSTDYFEAMELAKLLEEDIKYRVKRYSYCICKSTDNYVFWLQEDYKRKLSLSLNRKFISIE
ncbi:MAG: helicase-related protein, partial [Bacteroidota bacterium]|nr:helicase-related protein [Bacteroidota bacterium]